MWLKRSAEYLLKHPWQTVAITFLVTFVPMVGIIGVLIAALVTLCQGVIPGLVLTIAASLPYYLSLYLSDKPFTIFVWIVVGVAVLINVLTWLFAILLRHRASWSAVLQMGALLGVLVISVIHLVYPDITTWWGNLLQNYYVLAQKQAAAVQEGAVNTSEMITRIQNMKFFASGLMASVILFQAILQVMIARGWQLRVFGGSLANELQNIRLSKLAGILFLAGVALSYFGNAVVLDVIIIPYLLFAGAGLSLVHYYINMRRRANAWLWLSLIYLILIVSLLLASPIILLWLAMMALLDVWLDLRKRINSTI